MFFARPFAGSSIAGLVIAALLTAPLQAQIYVSPQGSDHATGTRQHPVQHLARAVALARSSGHRIVVEDGLYRLSRPLVLTPADSGLTLQSAPNAHPLLSGSARITGWVIADPARNLWKAPAPAELSNSRQMYVNGIRAPRTKGRVPVALTMTSSGYTASSDLLSRWRNPSDIEFVYTGGNSVWNEHSVGLGSWTQPRCPIASISGDTITMAEPCWKNSTDRVFLPSGIRTANLVGPKSVGAQPSYVENAYELLGTPGEWYFDRSARVIYYTPRKGEDLHTADVEVPVLQKLLEIQGTVAQPAHDIRIQGLQFSYATWLEPSTPEGFSEIQANYMVTGPHGYDRQGLCDLVPNGACPFGVWTKAPGNVSVQTGRNIHFADDVFTHLGAAGLDFGDGTQNSTVEGCIFTDISGNGLQLGGVDQPLAPIAEFTANNRITDNLFRNVGAEYRGGIAIVIGYARSTVIAHNELDHLPYAGISIGWGGWPDKIKLPGQANNSAGNVIEDNRIHDFMLVLSDGGGIYTQGRTGKDLASGERIQGNVITDQYSSGHGIYTDNGSAMITIDHNVVFKANHDDINSKHHDYYDGAHGENFNPLDIEGNWYQQGDPDSDKQQVRYSQNHLINALDQAPHNLLEQAGLQPAFQQLLHAVTAPITAPEAPSRVASFGKSGSAYVTWNPSVFDGGSAITSYTITASDGTTKTVSEAEFMQKAYVDMTGLTNGRTYTFTVTASNAHGTSVPSLPSPVITVNPITIAQPPAPAKAFATMQGRIISVHFQSPAISRTERDHEAPIIAYEVTIVSSGRKVFFTGRNVIALQDGTHTTFSTFELRKSEEPQLVIAAVNAAGEGKPISVPIQRVGDFQ